MITNEIETTRLVLRSTREEDAPFCLSMWLDDEMGKYMIDPPRDKVDRGTLNFAVGIEKQEGWYPFIAVLKETGQRIGSCSVVPSENDSQWDIGYSVHKDYWRQGYATEMVKELIHFGYRNGGVTFTAEVAQANVASNALIKKLGFHIEREDSFRKRQTDIIFPSYVYRLDVE